MDFDSRVYALTKKVPKGKITTYREIAKVLKTSPRAVGQALHRNPAPIVVPCHRVVMSNGKLGGFGLGVKKKIELLRKEGVEIKKGEVKRFEKHLYKFI